MVCSFLTATCERLAYIHPLSDGNFHESVMYNAKDPEERKRVEASIYRMVDRALEMEGTCTGEHGIGLGKKESLVKELGLDTIGVMQKIKAALDPRGLMNPGKVRALLPTKDDAADLLTLPLQVFDPPS